MTRLDCTHVRERLAAFHDGELPLDDHIAVASHLGECSACAGECRQLEWLAGMLRSAVVPRPLDRRDAEAMLASVVSRHRAEREQSLGARIGRMFEDWHLVYAALSATCATVVCATVLLSLWHFAPPERADSLSGILSALAAPGSDRNPVRISDRISMPRVSPEVVPAFLVGEPGAEDAIFALSGVVTQEGRLQYTEVLVSSGDQRGLTRLIDAASEVRFEPASFAGEPIAVNMVWLLTHTTVRGKTHG